LTGDCISEEILDPLPEEEVEVDAGDELAPRTVKISEKEYELFKWMKFYFANQREKQKGFDIQQYHAKRMGDARYEIGRILKALGAFEDPEADLKEPR
jgi:hypothetical protein